MIGVDEAASCIDVTTVQEFDIKIKKDSSDEESDGVPSDKDLEDDEKVSLLSDKEDEETTGGEITVDKAMEDKVMQALKPDKSTEHNLDEAPDDEDFVPGGKKKEHQKCDIQPNSGTRDGPICLDPTVLAVGQKEKSGGPCVCPSSAGKHEGIPFQVSWLDKGQHNFVKILLPHQCSMQRWFSYTRR